MLEISPTDLRLPMPPIPRPGERVVWHSEARMMHGTVIGHDVSGYAIIKNDFGTDQHVRFDDIRLENPFERGLPNWHDLPNGGKLLKPDAKSIELFDKSMDRVIPPGVKYQDLAEEIWGRGFEVFLVGGTVRDILAGQIANDVDLVTTMPLSRMLGFLQQMFRTRETGFDKRGYIRLGGTPASGDPFIDLKVFSDSLPGTTNATFGVGFARDVGFRDFTCNTVYYDPLNNVLVDPTGHGVADCQNKMLRLVQGNHDPHQMGQVFIRGVKFAARGFEIEIETKSSLISTYLPNVSAMKRETRKRYFCTQVMSKHKRAEDKDLAVNSFKKILLEIGCSTAWAEHFKFEDEELRDE